MTIGQSLSHEQGAKAFLGLGSNIGDRLGNLREAVVLLGTRAEVGVLRSSRVYETRPVGPPQPDFLNAVIEVESPLGAPELLDVCLGVETEMGRIRRERWGPRNIDIDVLTYGSDTVKLDGLEIPHPRMHERAFVLAPLLELDPDPVLPGGRRAATLRLPPEQILGVRLVAPPLNVT